MAGNDLLNGFQAGMQAFAPLVQAKFQAQKDARDTGAHMNALRLQAELAGQQQRLSQEFTSKESGMDRQARTADRLSGQRFSESQALDSQAHTERLARDAAAARREEFRATYAANNLHSAQNFTLGKERLALEGRSLSQQARMFDDTMTLNERKFSLDRALAKRSLNPMLSLANDIADTQKQLDDWTASAHDPSLSDFERRDAFNRASSLATGMDMTMQQAHGMLNNPAISASDAFGVIASRFKRNPLPAEHKTVSVTDATGATDVGIVTPGADGLPALRMLPRVPKEGAAPAAPGIPGAFGAPKPTPNRPAGGALTGAVPPRPAGAPTSKYWNTPVPATP